MNLKQIKNDIDKLEKLNINLYGKNFLLTTEKSKDELIAILSIADILYNLYKNNISARLYESGLAISQFRDKSTRTRFSFASAINLLGLSLQELDEEKTQLSHGETVRETSTMISFLSEVIGIRDDMFIGKGNSYMREVGQALDDSYENKVIDQRPMIVNLQCDIDHPTQTMADLLHLIHHFDGDINNLKGKKIAMTWAYSPSYGKPLSVPQGIITLMTRFGMDVTLAYPEGYDLLTDTVQKAKNYAKENKSSFKIAHSMEQAFKDADIVYPKSWAPFNVMEKRTKLLEAGDNKGLHELEKECLSNNAKFADWECNEKIMKSTKEGKALYMHCLPADISDVSCKKGEVSAKVFDKYRVPTYIQARNKPFIIAAMILSGRFKNPASTLNNLLKQQSPRIGNI